MSTPIVYLAGAIDGLLYHSAAGWRSAAKAILADCHNIEALDPLRGKEHRTIAPHGRIGPSHTYANAGAFYTAKGIMARDFNDMKRCDALLVNLLGLTAPSKGTIMELAWAYALQKPAVVVMEAAGNPHDNHPMLQEAMPFRVETLEEGIHAVAVVLGR